MEAAKKLFQLTDLNGDGLITPEEFALMGLNQTKAHADAKQKHSMASKALKVSSSRSFRRRSILP